MVATIWAFVLFALPSLLKVIFTFLGIAFVSFIGIDLIFNQLTSHVFSNYNNLASDVLQILHIANVDTVLEIIISSMIAGASVKTALSSTKRFKFTA